MSRWMRRFVGAVVMSLLAGLPVMATICAALCETPVTSASTSGQAGDAIEQAAGASCHEPSTPADRRIGARAAHDCTAHDGAVRDAEAALTSGRANTDTLAVADSPTSRLAALASSTSRRARAGYSPPPGTSPTHTPLVLRV